MEMTLAQTTLKKSTNPIPFMTLKSLVWFDDAENDPEPVMLKSYSWETVKRRIVAEVKRIG